MIDSNFYSTANEGSWFARIDGFDENQLRWHQSVEAIDIRKLQRAEGQNNIAILGFASDEGVKRNKGRVGAAKAPERIRRLCSSLPMIEGVKIYDAGDVSCYEEQLEKAQQQLAVAVGKLLSHGYTPLLLGGGHEIVYGHYKGVKQSFSSEKVGIISFDAHFDLRKPDSKGVNSGTGFWQIAEASNHAPLDYLAIGIQKASNTRELFEEADKLQASYIFDSEFNPTQIDYLRKKIASFCDKVDKVYLTIDMDAFSSAYAPGVSASNPKGLTPDFVFDDCLKGIFSTGKVVSIDLAEVNPNFDLDNRTSKLAARLIFDMLNLLSG